VGGEERRGGENNNYYSDVKPSDHMKLQIKLTEVGEKGSGEEGRREKYGREGEKEEEGREKVNNDWHEKILSPK
jgi:hypothetical protein